MTSFSAKSVLSRIFILGIFFMPIFTFAVAQCNDGLDNDSDNTCDFDGCTIGAAFLAKDVSCSNADDNDEKNVTGGATDTETGGADLSFPIENPLDSDIDTLPEFINRLVEIFLMIGTPIVSLMIIYAGFLFVVARGNAEAIEKAKKTLGYTLLGAAILLGAFVISTAIQDTILTISKESETP